MIINRQRALGLVLPAVLTALAACSDGAEAGPPSGGAGAGVAASGGAMLAGGAGGAVGGTAGSGLGGSSGLAAGGRPAVAGTTGSGGAGLPAAGAGGSGSGGGGRGSGGAPLAGGGGSSAGAGGVVGPGGAGAGGSGGSPQAGSGGRSVAGMGGGGTGAGGAPAACATNQVGKCTGANPIECHFGGNPGDYLVTVELGGSAASDTYVEAESFRRMLGEQQLAAGETRRFSFFVNVREPEGQPIQDVPAGTPGLDLYFHGSAPALSSICSASAKSAPKLWIAGDSTVCDQDTLDYAGWGQHLPQFFVPPISVANYADSGESSGSFLGSSKLWGAIKAGWASGDYVLIQLGHNDKDVTAATFQANMTSMVTQAKAAGVNPILVTPTSRVGYALADEHVNSTGANLPQIIRDLGASQNVPVIDLTVTTWNWLQTIDWTGYYALGTDHTHTNPKGAEVIAGFVRDAIVTQKLPLAAYVR